MVTNAIHSAYRRYKEDTDSVASWLASTAKQNGYPADLICPPAQPAQPAGRLKGKARKLAREAAKSSASDETKKKEKAKYIIALSDFVQLANFLARKIPEVAVPEAFITTLNRLITQRRGFEDLLAANGHSPDAKSVKNHGYFVSILETVRDLLCPPEEPASSTSESNEKMKGKPPATPTSNDNADHDMPDDPIRRLGSRFSSLSVDEPSQTFMKSFSQASITCERPIAHEDDPVAYEAEPQTATEDVWFVCFALTEDLNQIRECIRSLWIQHLEGLDIAAAAIATNVALSVARGLIQEAMPILKTIEGGLFMGALEFVLKISAIDGVPVLPEDDARLQDLWDRAFVSMFLLFQTVPVGQTRRSMAFVAGKVPDHLSEAGWDLKTDDQKIIEGGHILIQHASDMAAVIGMMPTFPFEDEILKSLREWQETGETSLHLAFAGQVFIDIHFVLKDRIRPVFAKVKAELETITREFLPYLQFLIKSKQDRNDPDDIESAIFFGTTLLCFHDDWIFRTKNFQSQSMNDPPFPKTDQYRTWMQSPILSGLLLFFCRERMRSFAMRCINNTRSFIHSAHLYNALQKEAVLDSAWDDMNLVLSLFGDSNFWVGGERPAEASNYLRKYHLQEGFSAANFANNTRHGKKKLVKSRNGPRNLQREALASTDFPLITLTGWKAGQDFTRWLYEQPQNDLFDSFSPFQQESFHWEKERIEKFLGRSDTQAWLDYMALSESPSTDSGSGLDVVFTCRATALVLDQESYEMKFPYLRLHNLCRDLLIKIMRRCRHMINKLAPECGFDEEVTISSMTHYIFSIVSSPSVKSDQLKEAMAKVFAEWLSEGNGEICTRALGSLGQKNAEDTDTEEEQKETRNGLYAAVMQAGLRGMLSEEVIASLKL